MRRRWTGLAILAVALELTGCATPGTGDAITRAIASGEDAHASLMTRTFAPSLTGSEVIRQLEAAGYRRARYSVNNRDTYSRDREPIPADGRHYVKFITQFPCLNEYEVVVRIDPSDHLIDVYGTHWQPACT
jgi:hypothetical protein